ncbi:MAG TPA: hypothetical protein VH120_19360 [Gemmataceae bacterium]|nr:hypothetical protein [Gemmataceae bacterium]
MLDIGMPGRDGWEAAPERSVGRWQDGRACWWRSADEVRAARVHELLARLATLPPADGPGAASSARITAEIEALRATPVETILEEFRVAPIPFMVSNVKRREGNGEIPEDFS